MASPATRLYFASPIPLQHLMVSAYGFRLRYLRYGALQRRTLAELRRSQWRPREELQAMQLAKLNELLRHAWETVPFYRDRGPAPGPLTSLEELSTLPLLRKDDLRTRETQLVSAAYRRSRILEIHTGGTTGKPLSIHCDRATLQRNYAFYGRLREWAGVEPGEGARVATFAGRTVVTPDADRPPFWRWNAAANTMLFSSYHIGPATLGAYVARLATLQPDLIDSYPSSLEPIARYMADHGIRAIRPRAVITSSETLDAGQRDLIGAAFGCPVFDHYGAAEMTALVTQCAAGSYHVNPEFGVVEVVHDGRTARPGESGEIVATGFINPVMPLIRYVTGDVAVQGEEGCACGREFPILGQVSGRRDDTLVTPEGRLIGRLDPIFKSVRSLYETQIVQDAWDHILVKMVAPNGLPPAEEESLLRELRHRLGPSMRIDTELVPRIPRTAAGKFRAVVNLAAATRAATASRCLPTPTGRSATPG